MPDATPKTSLQPGRYTVGRLDSASSIRCACRRIATAVLRGDIEPRKGSTAIYAITTAAKALQIEIAEEAVRAARALKLDRQARSQMRLGAIDAEQVSA